MQPKKAKQKKVYRLNYENMDFAELSQDAVANLKKGDELIVFNAAPRSRGELSAFAQKHALEFNYDLKTNTARLQGK